MMKIVTYGIDGASTERKFYVYTHIDPTGNVFYVGKGTARRAWSKDRRHDMWVRYIAKLNGEYTVNIVKDQLTELEALDLEDDLMREYGGQLVNWANSGLDRDLDLLDEYWQLRKANEEIADKAKAFEKTNLDEAINLYKTVIENMFQYETMNTEDEKKYTGLALQVYNEFFEVLNKFESGKLEFLDRLTVCLKKANRNNELKAAIERYIEVFPGALCRAGMYPIIKRAKFNQSEAFLIRMIEWTEDQNSEFHHGVHPWPYAELAKYYRKQKSLEQELSIIERFASQRNSQLQDKATSELLERLEVLKK